MAFPHMMMWELKFLILYDYVMPCAVLFVVAQPCPTFFDPMDCRPPGSSVHGGFSRQEYWSGFPCLLPGDLPNPGIEPSSPALQVDSLPSEPPGSEYWSPRILEWVANPFSKESSRPRNHTGVSCIARRFFTS